MGNPTKNAFANSAADAFASAVDHLVIQSIAKNTNLPTLSGVSHSQGEPAAPAVGGVAQGIEVLSRP